MLAVPPPLAIVHLQACPLGLLPLSLLDSLKSSVLEGGPTLRVCTLKSIVSTWIVENRMKGDGMALGSWDPP
jgi:hypothetical protein